MAFPDALVVVERQVGDSMLFQVTHHHNHETCPGLSPEKGDALSKWWDGLKKNSDVKIVGANIATTDHVFHIN